MSDWLLVGLGLTALVLMIEHWFPMPRKLHVVFNYVMGTVAILLGQSLWLRKIGHATLVIPLWSFSVVGGATVVLCYAVDWTLNVRVRAHLNESLHGNLPEQTSD